MDPSFWDLSHKVRAALFFLSFDSQSYARTTHPPTPLVPKNIHSSSPSYMLHARGRSIRFTCNNPTLVWLMMQQVTNYLRGSYLDYPYSLDRS